MKLKATNITGAAHDVHEMIKGWGANLPFVIFMSLKKTANL